jgi:hypothetical protein
MSQTDAQEIVETVELDGLPMGPPLAEALLLFNSEAEALIKRIEVLLGLLHQDHALRHVHQG